jgi:hypothetical protein
MKGLKTPRDETDEIFGLTRMQTGKIVPIRTPVRIILNLAISQMM